ncbi:hypothetical protein VTN77DRAFT_1095 [Rasamsonia byssochlamydoides]|uniref:uncharacterized protein n=1 Tax=Rasamsonia byssochlamydoides TaxID=89139 RepID=UPI00374448C5
MPTFLDDDKGRDPERRDGFLEGDSTAGVENAPSHPHSQASSGENNLLPVKDTRTSKLFRASVGKRIAARSPVLQPSPVLSLRSQASDLKLDALADDDEEAKEQTLFTQVLDWLQQEQAKRSKANGAGTPSSAQPESEDNHLRASSDRAVALDKLEKILLQYAATMKDPPRRSMRRRPSRPKGLRRGSASESDHLDVESSVPSVDAVLDNSKTLGYSGGAAGDEVAGDPELQSRRAKDREHWLNFKTEILRLTHTLRLKGWRRVPMECSGDIDVTRLSGALTNAVYVVVPPKNIPPPKNPDGTPNLAPRRPPPKLLLRIYGPQVDHLIDRDNELQILRRLGRKNIGPRVLGTFKNGRFEEFFNANPLTPRELRIPETSKQIAKRMRELHDGIELLEEERNGGPFVFRNWDKWVDRCEQVISWLDKEILSPENERKKLSEPWRKRGFVCGVPWSIFRKAVENYRKWLIDYCGGVQEINKQLVFAHNDTQYGNLLRLEPGEESPLLLPANEHKQLVVIDFEYASANTPGLEFANHFTEWCYNYHDAEKPWACNTRAYPTPEEQHRFISAYVSHHSQRGVSASPLATPDIQPSSISTPRLAPFSLDAPALSLPSGSLSLEPDRLQEETLEAEVQHLMRQTRLWRVANSAQWVAWGIVQAKVPGMEEALAGNQNGAESPTSADVDEAADADEFDYLAYAQDRALFFWADLLALGLIREDELPADLLGPIKARIVNY